MEKQLKRRGKERYDEREGCAERQLLCLSGYVTFLQKRSLGLFMCMRAISRTSCLFRVCCVRVCVCVWGVTVCKEDAQHASCPVLGLLFALCYPAVIGLCWNAVCFCVCVFKTCVSAYACA